MKSQTNDNEIFRKRLVVFLDILGFGNMVAKASKSSDLNDYKKIDDALTRIQSILELGEESKVPDLEVHIFSDSVILTIPPVVESIRPLFSQLALLMWDLMKLGVWIRGGISVGNHSLNSERPWGPAVIDAYRIEDKVASFPRIAFGAKALNFTKSLGLSKGVSRDVDGVYSIDAIKYILGSIAAKKNIRPETDISIIRDQLDNAHASAVENPSVYKKIDTLCAEWDSFFEERNASLSRDYRTRVGKENSLVDIYNEALDF